MVQFPSSRRRNVFFFIIKFWIGLFIAWIISCQSSNGNVGSTHFCVSASTHIQPADFIEDIKSGAKSIAKTAEKTGNTLGLAKDVLVSTYNYAKDLKGNYDKFSEKSRAIDDKYSGVKREEKVEDGEEGNEKAEKKSFSDKVIDFKNKVAAKLNIGETEGVKGDSEDDDYDAKRVNNVKELDKSLGFDTFLRPFIANLRPEFKKVLRGQPADYALTYNLLSQRSFALNNPIFRTVTDFDSPSSISEVLSLDKELYADHSFVQLPPNDAGETSGVPVSPGIKTTESKGNSAEPAKGAKGQNINITITSGKDTSDDKPKEKRVRLRTWGTNAPLYHSTVLKTLYLLISDVRTRDLKGRLANLAQALGYSIISEEQPKNISRAPVANQMGTDMFWVCGDNPFILGHLATLMLAYSDYDAYFGNEAVRSFYSWPELVRSGASGGISKLDLMCNTKRGSKYKRGSNGAIQKNSYVKKIIDQNLSSDAQFLCNLIEVLLRSIGTTMDAMGELLNQKGATFEPNVGAVTNGKRIQAKLCSNKKDSTIVVRCEFSHSILNTVELYNGIPEAEAQELRKRYIEAFDLFAAMDDLRASKTIPSSWFNILSDPLKFRSFFEMALMWDPRMFYAKRGKSWVGQYAKLEKKHLGINLSPEIVAHYNAQEYYRNLVIQNAENKNSHKVSNALQRLYIYMASSGIKRWIENNMISMQEAYRYPPSVLLGGALSNKFREFYNSSSVGLSHVFLYHFLSQKDPSLSYSAELHRLRTASAFSRMVDASNLFVPNKLKKVVKWFLKGAFVKKFMREKTKATLKQLLQPSVLRDALTSITFVTHSLANVQVNQSAHLWGNSFFDQRNPDEVFRRGGVVGAIDETIRIWSDDGYSNSIAEKLKNGEDLDKEDLKTADFQHIHNSESIKWDKHLNLEIVKAYTKFLELPSIKPLEGKGHIIYEIVRDSKDNLEQNLEDTIFFGRVVQPGAVNNKIKKFFKRITSFGKMLLNKAQHPVEHAVWFGIKLDVDKIMHVIDTLHKLQKQLSARESWNLQGGFIDVIEDLTEVLTNDTSRTPMGTMSNFGMPTISNMYGRMSAEERKIEFQQSMCAKHCAAIWKAILAFSLSTLRNPGSIKSYEKNLSKNSSLSEITNPAFVNNYRFILKGDAMMHMYDNMLPKSMKQELKSIKYGKAFYFANILKLASLLLNKMGFTYTAATLKVQAPYFGNFISSWSKKREDSKMKQIFSVVALGTMASYTVLECMDISHHVADMGHPPKATCFYLMKPPSHHCIIEPINHIAQSAAKIAMKDVFSSTILALIGPYFFLPMGIMATWNILKHQFKILHRLDIALSATFSRLWKRITSGDMIKKITHWFRNRKDYRKKIEAAAASKASGDQDVKIDEELFDDGSTFSYTHLD
ncbi:hypothetical protein BEWA_034640 [Theileria equi strain WA]|uniref:Rhoptry neck protein 2 n=1 Tax=Theileria equi strain WA TaxID=1537102 RepID=L0B023_THEEQ|nr:hypothetical protein BEWA_034640 [Theileria equi strain WA]AFZ80606.1 hypothetical protein BEWA_034640 [Theileria equi strain WA]|eukprot:XP_004830272.1 hypothetical protein BEWA_034640 [Theileria equi strain WA]